MRQLFYVTEMADSKKRHPPGVMPRGRCPASMPLLVILTTLCRPACRDSPSSSFAMAPGKHYPL